MRITNADELASMIGQTIWIVTPMYGPTPTHSLRCFYTSLVEWVVGGLIDHQGVPYLPGSGVRPIFCFEANRIRMKGNEKNIFLFSVEDYLKEDHGLFTTKNEAQGHQIKIKLTQSTLKMDQLEKILASHKIIEGVSISEEDIRLGNLPNFNKGSWSVN